MRLRIFIPRPIVLSCPGNGSGGFAHHYLRTVHSDIPELENHFVSVDDVVILRGGHMVTLVPDLDAANLVLVTDLGLGRPLAAEAGVLLMLGSWLVNVQCQRGAKVVVQFTLSIIIKWIGTRDVVQVPGVGRLLVAPVELLHVAWAGVRPRLRPRSAQPAPACPCAPCCPTPEQLEIDRKC